MGTHFKSAKCYWCLLVSSCRRFYIVLTKQTGPVVSALRTGVACRGASSVEPALESRAGQIDIRISTYILANFILNPLIDFPPKAARQAGEDRKPADQL